MCSGDAVHCMALSSAGDRLAVGGKAKHIVLYGLAIANGVLATSVLCRFTVVSGGTTLSLSLDGEVTRLDVT
jgi:hypothetical protein